MALLEAIAEQDGEITPEQEKALAISQYELETKAVDYGQAIIQLKALEKMAADEEKRIKALKTTYKNTYEMLSQRLTAAMEKYELSEVKSATIKVSLRHTQAVPDDYNISEIPREYKTIKIEEKPDKTAIKKAILDMVEEDKNNGVMPADTTILGAYIPGVRLTENVSLIIK